MNNINVLSLFIFFIIPFCTTSLAQYQNVRIDGPQSILPEEVTIAINPLNPDTIAGGANLDHLYISSDGGMSWDESHLNSNFGVWGDPCVLFDTLGNLYYAHLSNPVNGWWVDRIVVQKSTDNGQTWISDVGIGQNVQPQIQDKEWLGVDLTQSPYRGNIYLCWTEFDNYNSENPNDSSRIRFSRSTDQGETFSDAITISDRSGDCLDSDNTTEGAVPTVGPNGEVYTCWAGPLGLMFDKSLDGGITWGTDVFVSDMPGGWDFNIPGISRCDGFPITMCDISNSPYRGNIYICWGDQRNGTADTDVFFSRSTDGGDTWSPALRVNDDNTTRHQFFPWMTVDPKTGYLWGVFYDRRNTTGVATDVYVVKSTDGGQSFENFRVNESSFSPTIEVFFGDYINIAAWDGKIFPIWMRLHEGLLSVWTAVIDDPTPVKVSQNNFFKPNYYILYQNYPNPFNPTTTISYQLPSEEFVTVKIFDAIGKEVDVLVKETEPAGVHEVNFDASHLASGIYMYRIDAGSFHDSKKMLLVK